MIGTKGNNLQAVEKGRQFPRPPHVGRVWDVSAADFNFICRGSYSGLPYEALARLWEAARKQASQE